MSETSQPLTEAQSGKQVRFFRSQPDGEKRLSHAVTVRALRRSIGRVNDENDAAVFADLFQRMVRQEQYTEGHHPVSVELTGQEIDHLHLAHMVAAESIPSYDDDIAATFTDNKRLLPANHE